MNHITGTCKGCNLKDRECVTNPIFKLQGIQYECPCQICLIKPMCKQPCDEFKMYTKYYYDLVKQDLSEYITFFSKIISNNNPNNKDAISYMRTIPMYMRYQDIPNNFDFSKLPKVQRDTMIKNSYYGD